MAQSTEPATPAPEGGERVVSVERRGNGMAVAALVCGIIGAVIGLVPILFVGAFVLGVLALVFGLVGRGRAKREPAVGRKTMATWGAALGVVAVILGFVGVAIVDDASEDLDRDLDVEPDHVLQLGEPSGGRPLGEGAVWSSPVIELEPAG